MTGLSGEYVTFDQNGAKMHGNIEILLEHSSGKIGRFDGLTMLILEKKITALFLLITKNLNLIFQDR